MCSILEGCTHIFVRGGVCSVRCRGGLNNNNGAATIEIHLIIQQTKRALLNNLSFANSSRVAAALGGPACQDLFIGTKRDDSSDSKVFISNLAVYLPSV